MNYFLFIPLLYFLNRKIIILCFFFHEKLGMRSTKENAIALGPPGPVTS